MAEIAVLGLGPVGLATAWGLLERGHTVHAYDTNRLLADKCRKGEFPRAEELSQELCAEVSSRFLVHENLGAALSLETVVICVGTPAHDHGFNLQGIRSALLECRVTKGAGVLRHYIIRSTLIPGTTQQELLPVLLEGEEFDLSYYPEFLREKFLREDSLHPPLQAAAHSSSSARERFSRFFPGEFRELDFASAEALKIACNAFHAMKVVFANEIADLCERTGASAESVMRVFCEDGKLNLSSRYLKPGAPFDGPCLDKDLRALEGALDNHGLKAGLLRSIRKSNDDRTTEWKHSK